MIQPALPLSTRPISLQDLCRGLVLLNGLSVQEAAIRSGVSPGSVAALTERTPQPVETWLRLLGAFGATLVVRWQGRERQVTVPRPAAMRLARERGHWRHRRLVSARAHVADADARLTRVAREEKAGSYVANEEANLRDRLARLRADLAALAGRHRASGLREAVQLVARLAAIKAEELALLAGVSLGAAQLALGDDGDGRLATLHRLLSALNARIAVAVGAARIDVALCPPGDWRPGEPATAATRRMAAEPAAANRSRLAVESILALYDTGASIGEIARAAGVSRQRVHKLAMDHGRTPRRLAARDDRAAAGRRLLGG